MSVVIEPKAVACTHCDFGGGTRGMDRCAKCDGTGSVFRVGWVTYPNTKQGYIDAVCFLNDPEGEREKSEQPKGKKLHELGRREY